MNEQINGTAAEIEAAREILDTGGIPADTYWYQAIVGEDFGDAPHWHKSDDWVTCACGERRGRITWISDFKNPCRPEDEILYDWGIDFEDAVHDRNRVGAAQTLVAIEKRVQELEGVG